MANLTIGNKYFCLNYICAETKREILRRGVLMKHIYYYKYFPEAVARRRSSK